MRDIVEEKLENLDKVQVAKECFASVFNEINTDWER